MAAADSHRSGVEPNLLIEFLSGDADDRGRQFLSLSFFLHRAPVEDHIFRHPRFYEAGVRGNGLPSHGPERAAQGRNVFSPLRQDDRVQQSSRRQCQPGEERPVLEHFTDGSRG